MRRPIKKPASTSSLASLEFFSLLRWIDGRPLLDTMETYRRKTFSALLDAKRPDGSPQYNLGLLGRGKKNWKSADLVLCAFFKLMVSNSVQGNLCCILANDLDQANDDLSLAKKIVACNPVLSRELKVERRRIVRKDGRGELEILAAGDAAGSHGKSPQFLGFDEIHGYKNYDTIEALQPDPTRTDALTLYVTYDTFYNQPAFRP